jgi:multimeric flavodoxin WrbA
VNIAFINASPRRGKYSTSGALLGLLRTKLDTAHHITEFRINGTVPVGAAELSQWNTMDALVLAFPLYVNSMPSYLLRVLSDFHAFRREHTPVTPIHVYVLMNNGFYEGSQNHIALSIMKNWCNRCGLMYGQGIGHGAGGMIGLFTGKMPLGEGPLKNLGSALIAIAANLQSRQSAVDVLTTVNMPYLEWKTMTEKSFWLVQAKKHGLTTADLQKQPE